MLWFGMTLIFIGGMLIGAGLRGMAYARGCLAEIGCDEAYVCSWRKSIEELIASKEHSMHRLQELLAEKEPPVGERPDIRPRI